MTEKVPCIECGAMVLPATAERTGGLCMPCKNGNRESMEQAKEYYKKERELDKTCPYRAFWRKLVDKVYDQKTGFSGLTDDEKLYYSVNVLSGEVYNGGFMQFFDNTSGEHYRHAELGLIRLNAIKSLKLLRKAKHELFGDQSVPKNQTQRWLVTQNSNQEKVLDSLDTKFYEDPDNLGDKLEAFAQESGLVKNA